MGDEESQIERINNANIFKAVDRVSLKMFLHQEIQKQRSF